MTSLTKYMPVYVAVLLLTIVPTLMSCDRLHEDLEPCKTGVRLRFVYDYNMEFADAFASQVDCLSLLVYDKDGNYLRTVTASEVQTHDENWRMDIDLPAGQYSLLAYGGMECEKSSFDFVPQPESVSEQSLEVVMKSEYLTRSNDKPLHHLFYGRLDLLIPPAGNGTTYTEATVYMKKDTNDIRILLANDRGQSTDADDFEFTITDNNTRLNWLNIPVDTDNSTYYPWIKGNSTVGVNDDNIPVQVAFAELSTSRLMADSHAMLYINRVSDGKEVVRIPLVNILLLLRSERFSNMKPQEFLDRQSRWNLTFFLTGEGEWLKSEILINDWVVRINNIDQW